METEGFIFRAHRTVWKRYVRSARTLTLGRDSSSIPIQGQNFEAAAPNKQKHEVLSIPETNAVINPWTMMVHVQHTSVTSRAMMASFGLEHVTH